MEFYLLIFNTICLEKIQICYLQILAKEIGEHELSSTFLQLSTKDGDTWLQTTNGISQLYLNFLEKFGHRCLREVIQKTEIFHNTLRNTQASIFTV